MYVNGPLMFTLLIDIPPSVKLNEFIAFSLQHLYFINFPFVEHEGPLGRERMREICVGEKSAINLEQQCRKTHLILNRSAEKHTIS